MVACRMTTVYESHIPVLLNEVIENLAIKTDGIYVDATFGRGGHSTAILQQLGNHGRLIAFDKDPEAIAYAKQLIHDKRFSIIHASFSEIKTYLTQEKLMGHIDGILFDLGVSSPQLDNPNRGFSFMRNGHLDMRMDITRGEDASTFLNTIAEEALTQILFQWGEERFARRIAKAIVTIRQTSPITTTDQLTKLIEKAVPYREKHKHPATRSFQAIRMAVNDEMGELQTGLEAGYELLKIKGRLCVISFHSLEDRLVKQFIQLKEQGKELPARLPVKQNHFTPELKKVGKAIKPSLHEIARNPRARSAILRIAEKLS